MSEKLYKIAVLNTHPIQYFTPMYAYLQEYTNIDITALYCVDLRGRSVIDEGFKRPVSWGLNLLSGYKYKFLGERSKIRNLEGNFYSLICPEIWKEIKYGGYDAIWLHGLTSYAAFMLAFLAGKFYKIPVFIRSDTHLGLRRNGIRAELRKFLYGVLYRFVDGFLAVGSANKDFYLSFGVPLKKIFDVPYAVDNDRFIDASIKLYNHKKQLKNKYRLKDNLPIILFSSKLIESKRPCDLIIAVKQLKEDYGIATSLLIVGSGIKEKEIHNFVDKNEIANVVFTGFLNQMELPEVFAISDVFVLPAENEAWGLIVNEAMCSSLPIILSEEIGCAKDLLIEGVNGIYMQPGNISSITSALKKIIEDEGLRVSMGKASLDIIKKWSYRECAVGLLKAIKFANKSN